MADISNELQAFDLSMDKIARIINSVSSHFAEINQLESHISNSVQIGKRSYFYLDSCIEREINEVRHAQQALADAQVHLQNVTQYDEIAKEVFSVRSRDDLKR